MKKVFIVNKQAGSRTHINTRDIILNSLISHGISYELFSRKKLEKSINASIIDEGDYDMVISLGGDGTFLFACHLVQNSEIPVLGVNSDNFLSEGFMLDTDHSTLETRLENILTLEKLPVKTYPRLISRLIAPTRREIPAKALNEVHVGRLYNHKMARYEILLDDGQKERQKSSGVLVSTGLGSTAWYKSAGGTPFSKHADHARFLVRECYSGRLSSCKIIQGHVQDKLTLRIVVDEIVVAMDSIRHYPLSKGDTLVIEIERDSITIVDFSDSKLAVESPSG
ncbi:MAG: NAD(+)/NADH kinase [Candidatus Hodarchaeales archaeon]